MKGYTEYMKIEWNKVTWYSKLAAVILGVGIFALGVYIGMMYQRGLDAIELAGQLTIERPTWEERKTESIYEFVQEGNIKNTSTGDIELDEWILAYERPGTSALTKSVIFTTQSRCVLNGLATFCDTSRLEQGQRVKVMGWEDELGAVIVERLEIVR